MISLQKYATINTDLLPAAQQAQLAYTMFDKVKRVELGDDVLAIGFDSIDIGGLTPGFYTLMVTLEGGKSYSDTIIKN